MCEVKGPKNPGAAIKLILLSSDRLRSGNTLRGHLATAGPG